MDSNRSPDITRVSQESRDKDFISINELKQFDDRLNEIIQKFSSSANAEVSANAKNIGEKIRQIEFNMSDAILYAEDGTISGFQINPNSVNNQPLPGENSYENMVDKLNTTYNEFMKLFGNDENVDNWKYELEALKNAAITAFQNKINGIFGRIAEQNAIEAKDDGRNDYVTASPIQLKMNEIMRLNPDRHSFIRQIVVTPSVLNTDVVAFEVGELEAKSLVLNMKIQNNDLYYNYNIIIDNNKAHIIKEEHIKLCTTYSVTIKIFKYYSQKKGRNMYAFVLNSSNMKPNVSYGFEITGLLINGYDFGSTGLPPANHGSFYAYHEVDPNSKPDYDKIYYIKVTDDSGVGDKAHFIVYKITEDTIPNYQKIYYTKTEAEDGTIRYKSRNYLTEFDPKYTYYERSEEDFAEGESIESQYLFEKYTNLRAFDPDKTYYTKDNEWELIKSFTIKESEVTQGSVDDISKDIDGELITEDNNQMIIEGVKYGLSNVKYKNIDIDSSELFGNSINSEKAAKTSKLFHLDEGVRFYRPFKTGFISQVRRGAKKINGSLNISVGSRSAELITIQSEESLFANAIIAEEDITPVSLTELKEKYKLRLDTNDVTAYDVYSKSVNFFNILRDERTGKSIDSFGQVLFVNVMFVEKFCVKIAGAVGPLLDFKVICDNVDDYNNCSHIYYNTKSEEVIIPLIHNIYNNVENNTIIPKENNWIACATNNTVTVAVNESGEVFYTDDGKTWIKNYSASELEICDLYYNGKVFIGVSKTKSVLYVSYDEFFTVTTITINEGITDNYVLKTYGSSITYLVTADKILSIDLYNNVIKEINRFYDVDQAIDTSINKIDQIFFLDGAGNNINYDEGRISAILSDTTGIIAIDCITDNNLFKHILLPGYNDPNYINDSFKIHAIFQLNKQYSRLFYTYKTTDGITTSLVVNTILIDTCTLENQNIVFENTLGSITIPMEEGDEVLMNISDATYAPDDAANNDITRNGCYFFNPILSANGSKGFYRVAAENTESSSEAFYMKPSIIQEVPNEELTGKYVQVFAFPRNINLKKFVVFLTSDAVYYATDDYYNTLTKICDIEEYNFDFSKLLNYDCRKNNRHCIFNKVYFDPNIDLTNFKTDEIPTKYIILGTSQIHYIDFNGENYFVATRRIGNSILSLSDINERGNDVLIADSLNGILQYDDKSGLFTKNVIDKDEYFHYKSTSLGVFAYGSSYKNSTFLVDWLTGRKREYQGLVIEGVLECGTNNTVYVFPYDETGLFQVDKETGNIERRNVFDSLANVKCDYGFETDDGLFIVGSIVETDEESGEEIMKEVLYFSPNQFAENTFQDGGPADTESQRTFYELLRTDIIDYCQPYDNEIIISAYDEANPNDIYYFERNKNSENYLKCVKKTVDDTNHVYSFNSIEVFNGKIFVLNGTGHNPNVKQGFGILSRIVYDSAAEALSDNKFFDINIITPLETNNTIEKMNSPSLFTHGGFLFGIYLKHDVVEDKSEFVVYVYMPNFNIFVKVTKEVSPLITSVINIVNREIKDIEDAGSDAPYMVSVQETNNKNVKIIKNNDFSFDEDNYQIDKIYFDKEIEGVELGSYIKDNEYFYVNKNNIAIGTTVGDHRTQIVLSLPHEKAIAFYDRELSKLKVMNLRYREMAASAYHYVNIDERMNIEGVFIGSGMNYNYLFVLIRGKFPTLTQNGVLVNETQTDEETYRLFKVNMNDLLSDGSTNVTLARVNFDEPTDNIPENETPEQELERHITNIKNYLIDNFFFFDTIDYNAQNHRQYIGTARDVLYPNVDSLVFWNTISSCLDIVSPIIWNNDIPNIELTNNEHEADEYKDYKVFASRNIQDCDYTFKQNKAHENLKFYSYDGEKNSKREIAVNYDDLAGENRVTQYTETDPSTGEEVTKSVLRIPIVGSFCRIGKTIFAQGGRLPVVTDITPNNNKIDELVSFKVASNPNFTLPEGVNITELRPTFDGALAYEKYNSPFGKDVDLANRSCRHFRINSDGTKASIDKFVESGINYYNSALQTRFGLFRWRHLEAVPVIVDKKIHNYSLYFNPKGILKTINIECPDFFSFIENIFESVNGVFISVGIMDRITDATETSQYKTKLYRMISVPIDDSHTIYLDNPLYFEEIDNYDESVIDITDTTVGTFAITESSTQNRGYALKWNGTTFYKVSDALIGAPIGLFDTSEGLFLKCKSVNNNGTSYTDTTHFWLFSEFDDVFIKTKKHDYADVSNPSYLPAIRGSLVRNQWGTFGHPTNRNYETNYGPVVGISNSLYNFTTRQAVMLETNQCAIDTPFTLRKYFSSNNYKSRNMYKLANYLHTNFEIPLDKNIKVFGSILYNGLQVSVSGMKILSNPGNSQEPFTVVFSIDKDMRFTRNLDTVNALFAKKEGKGYLENLNVGLITDYDPDTGKYYDHVFNISKVNLVAFVDNYHDTQEEEYEQNYDKILATIEDLKEYAVDALDKLNGVEFDDDADYAKCERCSDAYSWSAGLECGRNIAVLLGYPEIPSKIEMADIFSELNTLAENGDFSKSLPCDYLIFPELEGLNEAGQPVKYYNVRFTVYGLNTYVRYNSDEGEMENYGILFQSHVVFENTSTFAGAIRSNKHMADYIEATYGELKPVKRYISYNSYTNAEDLASVQAVMPLISDDSNATNAKLYTEKVFFPAEQEIGHPMLSGTDWNASSCCVWSLYSKAPQSRVKLRYGGDKNNAADRRHWWTETFTKTGRILSVPALNNNPDGFVENISTGLCIYVDLNGLLVASKATPSLNPNKSTVDNQTMKSKIENYPYYHPAIPIGSCPAFYL